MINFRQIDRIGNVGVGIFHRLALFAIGAATVWAAGWTFVEMFQKHHASIQDLLLLFIYLEIGAMVGIYFSTNHMPVRFLLYIAITAVVRHIVDLVTQQDRLWDIATMSGSTLVLALSLLVIRYGSSRFSDSKHEDR